MFDAKTKYPMVTEKPISELNYWATILSIDSGFAIAIMGRMAGRKNPLPFFARLRSSFCSYLKNEILETLSNVTELRNVNKPSL